MPQPTDILRILCCPVCESTLKAPTTLLCGHSLCSDHLQAPSSSCPVRGCAETPQAQPRPRIPPESTVRYTPAPNVLPVAHDITDQRPDVTLTALVNLTTRTARRLEDPLDPAVDSGNESDDDDALQPPNPGPTTTAAESADNEESSPRPRKRHKRSHNVYPEINQDDDEFDLLSHLRTVSAIERRKLLEELSCHICYVLFYQPVTTPCQHTFCAKCIQRSLDHSSSCPICRQDLPSHYFQDQPVNKTILSIILQGYPMLYEERAATIAEDERHARLNTPIFVCQLSFPGVPTLLHFFEPRYRLMLRRCLESPNPRFGMVMSPKPGIPQTDYGTMLEIRSVQMLPDGRSVVETWGSSRFRILERGTLDGYMVGRIEKIDDYADDLTEWLVLNDAESVLVSNTRRLRPDRRLFRRIAETLTRPSPPSFNSIPSSRTGTDISTGTDDNLADTPEHYPHPRHPTNEQLISTCKTFLDRLQRGAAPWVVQRLSSTYGAMPTDPALFAFWVALVLPLEEHEKAKLLPIRSPRLRLMLVVHWIEQLNNNWYAWLHFVVLHGWIGQRVDGPALPCLVWIAGVLTFFRLIGWI
ncbi:PUA-like domain-containing protein [Crepidotus variabilis]|uniref:PUA-like domain-containing protein n=1 Tax=Crepidotus variabilis TaxID=179855 RepID=A0A9P6ES83_9AGAR|nr:PUA-like domain-containing protein [Crepidotus variabilis]